MPCPAVSLYIAEQLVGRVIGRRFFNGKKGSKRLTPKGVLALKKEGYYADSEAVGLYCQVAYRQVAGKLDKKHGVSDPGSTGSPRLSPRRVRWMGLGSCDVIPLAEARTLATAGRRLVTLGADPIEHRKATLAAERESYLYEQASKMTFGDCVEAYLAEHLKKYRNDKHKWQYRETLQRASKAFGALSVGEIDAPMVIKFLTPIWQQTPETAARIRGRVEKVLDWAKVHQFRDDENPARWKGHLEHVFETVEGGNYAAMPFAELPAFMARLRERNSVSARALELLILTAARSGEICGATWQEVDLANSLWTIPGERMKAGREHRVPLSKQAVALLKALPRIGNYIFPGAVEGKPLSDMALMQLLRGMDANGYKVHGFRSTFRDWCGDKTEFENETIEFALAHSIPDSTKPAYRRYRSLEKRALLMQAWANYCEGAEIADNVVPLAG